MVEHGIDTGEWFTTPLRCCLNNIVGGETVVDSGVVDHDTDNDRSVRRIGLVQNGEYKLTLGFYFVHQGVDDS